jgi:hypothetical protein
VSRHGFRPHGSPLLLVTSYRIVNSRWATWTPLKRVPRPTVTELEPPTRPVEADLDTEVNAGPSSAWGARCAPWCRLRDTYYYNIGFGTCSSTTARSVPGSGRIEPNRAVPRYDATYQAFWKLTGPDPGKVPAYALRRTEAVFA